MLLPGGATSGRCMADGVGETSHAAARGRQAGAARAVGPAAERIGTRPRQPQGQSTLLNLLYLDERNKNKESGLKKLCQKVHLDGRHAKRTHFAHISR